MKVLVAGAGGQVGRALVEGASEFPQLSIVGLDRHGLDLEDPKSIAAAFTQHEPGVAINAAAYTAVDAAESDAEVCALINAEGPRRLAIEAASRRIPLFHISTDYVFSGDLDRAYREDDETHPTGVYGATKLAGEVAVREQLDEHLMLRVSWVFGVHGKNFVKTMVRLAREREELRVVADQVGRPTPARAIAGALLEAADRQRQGRPIEAGTYHFAGDPATSWHGFAEAIIDRARQFGPIQAERVLPITTDEFPTPARRPANSELDCRRYTAAWETSLPAWSEALESVIRPAFLQ